MTPIMTIGYVGIVGRSELFELATTAASATTTCMAATARTS